MLARYRRQDLPHDLVAGLSVAAVALPVGVAYAELAGFNPVVGLYSGILLGEVAGTPDYHSVARHPDAKTIPGLCLFRFNAPVVFFNAPYFKRSALAAAVAAGPELQWFVLDAVPITSHDATGRHVLRELERELAARRVQIVLAGRRTEVADWRVEKGFDKTRPTDALHYSTMRTAVQAFQKELSARPNATR